MPLLRHATFKVKVTTSLKEINKLRSSVPYLSIRHLSITQARERSRPTFQGNTTNPQDDPTIDPEAEATLRKQPFYFQTAYSIYAKRPSRPFPPPFLSLPSGSFSDPLTTHERSRDRRPLVKGQLIKGRTNGDDSIIIGGEHFLAVGDGVGAWAQKERGHAALWSRLVCHFWSNEVEAGLVHRANDDKMELNPTKYLQSAFESAKEVTNAGQGPDSQAEEKEKAGKPDAVKNEIQGTTTIVGAVLHYVNDPTDAVIKPRLYVTNLGDSAVMVLRPNLTANVDTDGMGEVIYHTQEQWHWFDCPRQLGTNSPDTPDSDAITDVVDIEVGDVVLALSDGVTDNLWEHEICENVCDNIRKWLSGDDSKIGRGEEGLQVVAKRLMDAARVIAEDMTAESPFMERAVDEGLAMEGGKLDDISVVLGVCKRRES